MACRACAIARFIVPTFSSRVSLMCRGRPVLQLPRGIGVLAPAGMPVMRLGTARTCTGTVHVHVYNLVNVCVTRIDNMHMPPGLARPRRRGSHMGWNAERRAVDGLISDSYIIECTLCIALGCYSYYETLIYYTTRSLSLNYLTI